MTYLQALKILYNERPHGKVKIGLGLRRIEKLLELLGNPQNEYRSVHITGTNGKGSVARVIHAYLSRLGVKTGAFFSPHLYTFRERILINEEMISEEEVTEVFQEVYEKVRVLDSYGEDWRPSFFETLTAMVYVYFKKKNIDWAVIEVGLGGRLDATNVIIPEVSIITTVDYDHMKILGDSLEKIAWEKAGIIKRGVPVVTGETKREPLGVIERVARENEASLSVLERDFFFCDTSIKDGQNVFSYRGDMQLKDLNLNLRGRHQVVNASVAIRALEVLGLIEEHTLRKTLSEVVHPGRYEVIEYEGRKVVLDGAHNVSGMAVLARSLEDYFPSSDMVGIIGILDDKQRQQMVDKIHNFFAKVYISRPKTHRAERYFEVCSMFRERKVPCELIESGVDAFYKALKDPAEVIVVAGSLYLVGEIRMIIKEGKMLPEWNLIL